MIPGSNLLNMALGSISPSVLLYYQFVSNSTNDLGIVVPVYADPIDISGSFQPVPRSMYAEMGLDLNKKYANFYASSNILDLNRGITGDGFQFQNEFYKCESATLWYGIDGWTAALLVNVPSLQGA